MRDGKGEQKKGGKCFGTRQKIYGLSISIKRLTLENRKEILSYYHAKSDASRIDSK